PLPLVPYTTLFRSTPGPGHRARRLRGDGVSSPSRQVRNGGAAGVDPIGLKPAREGRTRSIGRDQRRPGLEAYPRRCSDDLAFRGRHRRGIWTACQLLHPEARGHKPTFGNREEYRGFLAHESEIAVLNCRARERSFGGG